MLLAIKYICINLKIVAQLYLEQLRHWSTARFIDLGHEVTLQEREQAVTDFDKLVLTSRSKENIKCSAEKLLDIL